MPTKSTMIAAKVAGSVALTPTSSVAMTRVMRQRADQTGRNADRAQRNPSPTTSCRMLERGAPNTIRMPISAVRWRTIVDSTPYRADAARITATTAKMPISVAVKRIGAIALSTNVVIGLNLGERRARIQLRDGSAHRGDDLVRIAARAHRPATAAAVAEVAVDDEHRFGSRRRQRRVALMRDDADHLVPLGLRRGDAQQQPLPDGRFAAERQRRQALVDDDLAGHVGLLIDDVVRRR